MISPCTGHNGFAQPLTTPAVENLRGVHFGVGENRSRVDDHTPTCVTCILSFFLKEHNRHHHVITFYVSYRHIRARVCVFNTPVFPCVCVYICLKTQIKIREICSEESPKFCFRASWSQSPRLFFWLLWAWIRIAGICSLLERGREKKNKTFQNHRLYSQ